MTAPEVDKEQLRAPTLDRDGGRRWIYPERRTGRLIKIRRSLAIFLMMVYLIIPFSTFQGRPLLRLDVLEAKAYFVGFVFNFYDASYLVFLLILAALLLFLVTSLKGRLWCGYACPQTVFVEWLIRPIEEFFEGPATRRRIRDQKPWTLEKVTRKVAKHLVYIVVISIIANALLGFFIDYRILANWITSSPLQHPWAFTFMILVSSALYLDLTWFREQFCSFLCPYARFQAVMIDASTPTIAYDKERGEPRRKRGGGDCIDCQLCVRVCPTGIDIRNGLQMECIQCGRCADACDEIQTNLKRPTGLIRTASLSQLQKQGRSPRSFRLRPFLYSVALLLTVAALGLRLGLRDQVKYTIIRQPGSTYAPMGDRHWGNYFTLRINNQSPVPQTIRITSTQNLSILCKICDQEIAGFSESKGLLVIKIPIDFTGSSAELSLGEKQRQVLPLILPENQNP